jgi:hypothetical protein
MYIKLNDTLRTNFGTADDTGEAADADSPPVAVVLEQGVALVYAPTVTNKATGLYEVAIVATAANGFEVGKEYSVYVTAAVGGITGRDGLTSFGVVSATGLATGAAAEIAAEVWDTLMEGAYTAKHYMRLLTSSAVWKVSGFLTSLPRFRDAADSKNRIAGTTTTDGRTVVTVDPT